MLDSLIDYSASNPFRDLDWRWRRAGALLANRRKLSRRRDDPWVRHAYKFRNKLAAARTPAEFWDLSEQYPGLYWAHHLHANREDDASRLTTHSLEARLLADQPRDEIMLKLRLPLDVIDAYHSCFFEVEPHLAATDFLQFKVLGDAVHRGLKAREYDALWKLYALYCGPYMLEALISSFDGPTRPVAGAPVALAVRGNVAGKMGLKAMITAQTLEVNGFTGTQILECYLRMVEMERKAGDGGGGQAAILQTVGEMMNALPFAVGRRGSAAAGRTPTRVDARLAYDDSAAELTGEELLRLGAGQDVEVDMRPFPPPPNRAIAALAAP